MKNSGGNRHSIRLPHYDYSTPGSYFITICTHDHECIFGEIKKLKMELNAIGQIVQQKWQDLSHRFPTVKIDIFVVMPNHTHVIITLVGAPLAGALQPDHEHPVLKPAAEVTSQRATARVAPTLGEIVGAFKSLCIHHCLQRLKQQMPGIQLGKLWQRNYHEHVIRNQNDYDRIAEYIQNNPQQWDMDSLNPRNINFHPYP